ncbi:SMP-30/gluconolactonase/LRE family protein [Kineosporia sp. J2-2]|uniref:SMP-30/gluconolactonase/LRE family protein n=1 Tax=Kineosporia corallincola TaxID=2835133 RepID=A0ABS5TC52_9ACTN|nr:SMP-30/gluconolactonase/LRE family protein [Kineosporia corallincola]MBT0768661.1 SMP-30/gluconolactonase/LRE family protein [Kineosporia corallincola]
MRAAAGTALTGVAVAVTAGLVLAGGGATAEKSGEPGISTITARQLMKVTDVHQATGMTLLEGPVFGPDGDLLVVDVTAPAGEPKVLRIDVRTKRAEALFTDDDSVFTSAQISPADGRLYLTDLRAGTVDSISLEGDDPRTFFSGKVEGTVMQPDDLTFDPDGNLYVSDTSGHDDPAGPDRGRIVRIDRDDGTAEVLAGDLPAPNGISFDTGFGGLWISQYADNRIDYARLAGNGRSVTSLHPAVYVDGGRAQVDSTAVDASGNIYQMFHNRPGAEVFSASGEHLASVRAPVPDDGDYSATNLAVRPGSREAYLTVSGPSGGFVYSFRALGEGIRQSNGG